MDLMLFVYVSLMLNFIWILQMMRKGYVKPRALSMHKSRRASTPNGLLDGAVSPVDFAIHCALYARGWGSGYRLIVQRMDTNQHMHEPCHLNVQAEYIHSAGETRDTIKRYVFDVYADQYTTKAIFCAALAKLIDGEDVEEIMREVSKGG